MVMKEKGFEELLTELEEIATKLEKEDLTLDESIKEFENGMKIAKVCNEKLEETEKRIHIILEEDGEISEEKFEA
ncbi:MAG: exodeoxyribonuclease VII small subunit [Clostridia bacterium]|nr:exodeoxyribonuclease VII small subunit [Clostridia bacterium]